jgi:WD40 repeat protein
VDVRGLAASGVRVLVAATGSHVTGSALPGIPSAATSAAEVARALTERCGVDADHLRTVIDPADPMTLGAAVARAADEAAGVLVFYYIGHGLVSAHGELHLATVATDDAVRGLAYKALPFAVVRDAVSACRARVIVIVLDCCFAGRADGPLGRAGDDGFTAAQVRGSYLLAAAAHDEQALAPDGEPCTAFSGALVELLREGDPRGPRWLTLDHAYRYLARALPARGLPRPRRHATGLADDLTLAANPGYQPAPEPGPRAEATRDDGAEASSPYPGLAAFGAEDARFFFGRDRLTAELAGRLAGTAGRPGPVVLVGPSGSGKSSLLRAGLVAAIERGELAGGAAGAAPVVLTPGETPLARLSAAGGDGTDRDGAVLLVDQFEEIFTLNRDEAGRAAFIEAVCGRAAPVVLALRVDCYDRCLAYPELRSALRDRQVLVGPMTEAELREAIEQPACAAGLTLQSGLTDLVVRDLRHGSPDPDGDSPDGGGALPLLAYALLSTWQRREGRELTLGGYQASGGIWGAVAQEAERVYGELPAAGQEAVRAILLAMVRIGEDAEDAEDVRRAADLDELMRTRFAEHSAAFGQARDALAGARLITLGHGSATMAHEALLRAWPRLRAWISGSRADLLLRQRFADAAATWQRAGRDPAALPRGSLLADARRSTAGGAHLSELEREFLDASTAADAAQQRAARRRTRRWQGAAAALAVLVAASIVLTAVAVKARHGAAANARLAQSQAFAAQALTLGPSDQPRAALLALAGWQAAHSEAALSSLMSTAADDGYLGTLPVSSTGRVVSGSISRGGRYIATASAQASDPFVHVLDGRTHRQVARLRTGGPVLSVAFSPDGRTLAAAVISQRAVWLWNTATWRVTRILRAPELALSVAFSPDGNLLAASEGPGQIHLWNAATGAPVAVLADGSLFVRSLAFSPGGGLLAAGGQAGPTQAREQGYTEVWDVRTHRLLAATPAPGADIVGSVAFSPDGKVLASAASNAHVTLWDTGARRTVAVLTGAGDMTGVTFSPDGLNIAAAGSGNQLYFWRAVPPYAKFLTINFGIGAIQTLASGQDPQTLLVGGNGGAMLTSMDAGLLTSPAAITAMAYSPGGQLIATAGGDGAVRLWDAATQWPLRVIGDRPGGADSLAFAPDGQILASGSSHGQVRLWDPATGALIAALAAARQQVTGLAFSPDGSRLAAISTVSGSGTGGGLQVWDTGSHKLAATVPGLSQVDGLAGPVFSPGGSLLAYGRTVLAGSREVDQVVLLNARTLRPVAALPAGSQVLGLAFSPDGQEIAASTASGAVPLWDTRTRRAIGTITGIDSAAHAVAFSPDGRTLAVGSSDDLVRLFDVGTRALVAQLSGDSQAISGVAFSPDGRTLVSGAADGYAILWPLNPQVSVNRLCQALQPGLAAQWASLHAGLGPPPCAAGG